MLKFVTLFYLFCVFLTACNFRDAKKETIAKVEKDNPKPPGTILRQEYEFIIKAVSHCLLQIRLGEIAQQKGSSPKVKEIALNQVKDHSKTHEKLADLSSKKNISIPTAPGVKDEQEAEALNRLNGLNFDRIYIADILQHHEEELIKYKTIAAEAKDPETKAFASGQLEVIQQHLDLAKAIKNALKE